MHIDLFGLGFEAPQVTFYLWTPWRASALEHRLFEALRPLPGLKEEAVEDGLALHVSEPKTWRTALQAMSRVLKGWQEEAEPGSERRGWRWLLEGDTDAYGYDQDGEPASLWALVQVSVERGGPGEADKGEDIDLEGFGVRIWPAGQ
jgi:hypothetical protein